jgi:hypothetical protein
VSANVCILDVPPERRIYPAAGGDVVIPAA